MTKALVKSLFLAGLLVLWAAGCDDNGNGQEDTDADVTPDPTPDPQPEDVTPDPVDDDVPDVPVDTPEEEAATCPEDNPPADIFIDVSGMINSLDESSVENSWTAAISPMDALTAPVPTPLGQAIVGADNTFAMTCVDVGAVAFGLIVLHDDDPSGSDDNFYPTGTGVAAYGTDTTDEERAEDVTDALVFAISTTMAANLGTMVSVDIDAGGLAMGVVVNETTRAPIDGATVSRSGGGALTVIYPTADFTGAETDGNTSANGIFIIADSPLTMIQDLTATAAGYTFEDHAAGTKGGFIFFLPMQGTPE